MEAGGSDRGHWLSSSGLKWMGTQAEILSLKDKGLVYHVQDLGVQLCNKKFLV